MRPVSGGELTVLNSDHPNVYAKLEIKNASGTWKDFTALGGKDYFLSARLTTDVDSPVWSLSASLKRDGEVSTESLSPLRGDSTLNVDDTLAPAPAINAARQWRVSVAVVANGASLVSGDWKELCAGYLDKPDFTSDPMTVEGRSVGVRLMDSTIRVKRTYSGTLADVAQQIVTDNLPSPAPTLYIPTPPAFTVTEYTPYQVSVMDALVTLALSTGWMVRDVYDPGDGVMKTAILDPGRSQATADATLTPTVYLTVDQASLDVANVRNVIEGEYVEGVTGEVGSITVRDPASIAAFGNIERYMKFSEDATSPINSGNEMLDMVNAALADLSTPKFDHVVTSTLFWPAEITDLYDFAGNAVHYDTTQRLASFGLTHTLENGHATTQFTCRGSPAGAYLEWIRRQGPGPQGPLVPPAPFLQFFLGEASQFGGTVDTVDGGIWLGYRMPKGVDEIRVHVLLGTTFDLGIPNIDGTTLALTIRRPEGDIGNPESGVMGRFIIEPGEYSSMALLSTRPGYFKRALFVGVRGGLTSKPTITRPTQAVDPDANPIDGTCSIAVVRAGSTNTVTVTPLVIDTDPATFNNWVCIMRNEHVLPPIYIKDNTTPVVFVDSGLPESADYEAVYDAFIWNNGKSGPLARATASAPTIAAPEWANGTPLLTSIAGVQKVELSWTGTTPGAIGVRVEASLDTVNVRTVGTGALASGTVYDTNTQNKLYRLVATNGGTDVAWSPWKWISTLPPTITIPSAIPTFINGTPKPVLLGNGFTDQLRLSVQWKCATPGAALLAVQRATVGAGGPYTDAPGGVTSAVATGTWISPDASWVADEGWFRLQARASDGTTVLATSTVFHYPGA